MNFRQTRNFIHLFMVDMSFCTHL
uniref:Uncharacterized protein n=1 Tax=Arundo donax TaxID=35708 RepID=A0A0A9B8Y7_ARUDO